MDKFFLLSVVALCSCLNVPTLSASETPSFYLKAGDTVVFYGDSITEQSFYTQFVELCSIIGAFSEEYLAKGINLADYETPMRSQAQWVAWGVRDRAEALHIHLRMLIRKADTGKADTGKGGERVEGSIGRYHGCL